MDAQRHLLDVLLGLGPQTSSSGDDTLALVNAQQHKLVAGQRTHVVVLKEVPSAAQLGSAAQSALSRVAKDLQPRQLFEHIGAFSVDLSDEQALQLQQQRGIVSVEADRPVPELPPVSSDGTLSLAYKKYLWKNPGKSGKATNAGYSLDDLGLQRATYGDTLTASGETLPWGVKAVWNGVDVSDKGNIGAGSTVFVIDSGVLSTTGDLNLNTAWSRSWISGESPFSDGVGHGTHVAGTVAALVNGVGIVGVAPGAQVVSLKVFDAAGGGASITSILDAINYAIGLINTNQLDRSKVVINMSLGGYLSSSLTNAIYNAANQGIRFTIAAGNSGQDVDGFSPANAGDHPNVYTVSAVDSAYKMASWSNWDRIDSQDSIDNIDLAAPGEGVLSYYQGGQLAYLSGTSMAAPHVAGLLLAGGVTAGELVTPAFAGTADPFALAGSTSAPPPAPTYSLEAPASLNEGSSLQINVSTTNVPAGTVLNLLYSGVGITTADLSAGSLMAQVTIDSSGRGAVSTTVLADSLSEGPETLQLALFKGTSFDTPVATASVTLNDTSQTPPPPSSDNQVLWGTSQSDTITAGGGNDRVTGVVATGTSAQAMGAYQVDVLTGGMGADVFVLGDKRGIFYDDRFMTSLGNTDYARIQDFQSGIDKIQLPSARYISQASNGNTSLYLDRTGNGLLDYNGRKTDELIAVFSNATLSSSDVIWA